jgi:acyl dehydratase
LLSMSSFTIDQLKERVGRPLGTSEPFEVTQDRVDLFADATEDHQWIHVDPERARSGPFGGPIAHGYLTLSLLPHLLGQAFHVGGIKMGVNYGLNRLRFPSPVPVPSTVRASFTLNDVKEVEGGVQVLVGFEVRVEGASKPAAAGEAVYNYYV